MRSFLLIATLGLLAAAPQAQQSSNSKWPRAQDVHQGFAVAAEPYSDPAQCKEKLDKTDPCKAGILPVDVYFRNDSKEPVHVDLTTIRFNVMVPNGQRFHLEPLSLEQVAERIAHPNGPSTPTQRRFPAGIPLPHGHKEQEIADKLQPFMISSDIIPPGGTIHGCLFFDVNHRFDLVPYASLYVPNVKPVASAPELIYFEVALGSKPTP